MKILLVRTSAMGDIVHCLPVLPALRRAHPGARIGWVVEKTFAPLLEDHPLIDRLIPVQMRAWRRNWTSSAVRGEIGDAIRAMRAFDADVAVDLMGNHKGGLLARLSGAARGGGPARADRRERSSSLWIGTPVATPGVHAVDKALDVLAGVDAGRAEDQARQVDFGGDDILPEPSPEAAAFLARHPEPYVVIQAGAGWGNKTYPPPWWGRVAQDLRRRAGIDVWVPIAPGEESLAQAVADASDGAARTVDAGPFRFLTALLRHARLVLGGDTGPIHLAHALGTPVLCLIGPTDPLRNGPYGFQTDAGARVLWHRLPCSNCYRRFREPRACLLGISPAAVTAEVLDMLEVETPPRATESTG